MILLAQACSQPSDQLALPAAGSYIGLESMGSSRDDITPDDTTDHWYHENRLTFRGDSAFLEQVPVVVKEQEKSYSASDGGFYSFRGKISQYRDSLVAHFLLVNHDYVLIGYHMVNPADSASSLSFEEKLKRGMLVLDSGAFRESYRVMVYPDRLIMDSVAYQRKN
ncbi:hypothetical protein [Hymenobacter elongatus]|uniref:Uncharacterized protein n=1 Tax=Hymenobacter elongatus TaxID=877208 RepID=A0A4Z0PQE8_9BACT|nr:hypothetical protein [Hymenobacter elongatus]TGE19321.1 hypothetical protein E5J99_03515 [Hymenobacter elongatus]